MNHKHPKLVAFVVASFILNICLGILLLLNTTAMGGFGVKGADTVELLHEPLAMKGNKSMSVETIPLPRDTISTNDVLSFTINLHGLCLLPGKASEIAITDNQGQQYTTSLAKYANNCTQGDQKISIPLSRFGIQSDTNVSHATISFWYPTNYIVDIVDMSLSKNVLGAHTAQRSNFFQNPFTQNQKISRKVSPTEIPLSSQPTATNSPSPTIHTTPVPTVISNTSTPSPTNIPSVPPSVSPTISPIPSASPSGKGDWIIQSVSSMKETKDKICGQDDQAFINRWVDTAQDLGANYVAVETPYDNPACGDAITYTKTWVDTIHSRGLKVWHRHMPLRFEGIYDTTKDANINYINLIVDYIKNNPTFFQAGDIFTPIPEPQNGGIQGITYCPQDICMFKDAADFNAWLRSVMTSSELTFGTIGLGGKMKIGYFGFDGFVTWGDNNPDWHGILEDATVQQMGEITIDHYPELVGDTMENDLNELQSKYPATPIIIGEWGTVTGGDIATQVNTSMKAAKRTNVVGFNYWHLGLGGNEALINDDFTHRANYDPVKSFYTGMQ